MQATLKAARGASRARTASVLLAPAIDRSGSPAATVASTRISTGRMYSAVPAENQHFPLPPFRPEDARKGVCVAGAGRMGQIRSQGVISNPGTFLSSVVDPDRQRAKALAQRLSVPAYW